MDERRERIFKLVRDLAGDSAVLAIVNADTEDCERAICRAAAEITKLTAEMAASMLGDYTDGFEPCEPLRRYAELAREEAGNGQA